MNSTIWPLFDKFLQKILEPPLDFAVQSHELFGMGDFEESIFTKYLTNEMEKRRRDNRIKPYFRNAIQIRV
jgi:hypothetical protein